MSFSCANRAPVFVVAVVILFLNAVVLMSTFPQFGNVLRLCQSDLNMRSSGSSTTNYDSPQGYPHPTPPPAGYGFRVASSSTRPPYRPLTTEHPTTTTTTTNILIPTTRMEKQEEDTTDATPTTPTPTTATPTTTTTATATPITAPASSSPVTTDSPTVSPTVTAAAEPAAVPSVSLGNDAIPNNYNNNNNYNPSVATLPHSCQVDGLLSHLFHPPAPLHGLSLADLLWWMWVTTISLLACWAFVATVLVDPGTVPHAFLQSSPKSSALAIKLTGSLSLCPPCAAFKPLRTHHCSRCNRCVLKYDHHCPWIGQCVGFFNYKLYLLFVLYMNLWSWTYIVLLSRHVLARFVEPSMGAAVQYLPTYAIHAAPANWIQIVAFVLSLGVMCLTLYLLVKHWPLARANVTTVEAVIAQWQAKEEPERLQENVYDLGVTKNLEQIFGDGDAQSRRYNCCTRWFSRMLPLPPYPKQTTEVLYSLQAYRSVLQPRSSPLSSKKFSSSASVSYGTLERSNSEGVERREEEEEEEQQATTSSAKLTGTDAIENMIAREDKFLGILYPTTIGRTIFVQ